MRTSASCLEVTWSTEATEGEAAAAQARAGAVGGGAGLDDGGADVDEGRGVVASRTIWALGLGARPSWPMPPGSQAACAVEVAE